MSLLAPLHPAVQKWFQENLGEPTPPQREGWPPIRQGRNTLIAAPTGSGKTLAAFLSAIDALIRQGSALKDETQILYVSPLRALSNDVQKNLQGPLAAIRALDPAVPEIRVLVRTGDTPSAERAAMARRPPHILVTTPESLYILLTSAGGRNILRTVSTVIVDEIHALLRDKRGSHLALSLERLEHLTGRPLQRVGLSATQKPLEDVSRFLVGAGRSCTLVDAGTFRALDLGIEVPPSPLSTVCSHEQWEEIYARIGELVLEHRTTLVFVNTRKMAERIAAQLTRLLGEDAVTSHHGSLSKARRLDAEQRLKAGTLRALVATASLELGIDVGDVDLAIQVGATRSIATFLQRVGRSGHVLRKTPKGRLFPLTLDELVEGAALVASIRRGVLDRTPMPPRPLDILAQQIVAAAAAEAWEEEKLFDLVRRAWPYRDLSREEFDRVVALHTGGRRALLHRDGVNGRLLGTKRSRLTALMSGGAIPDTADYQVRLEPEGTLVGTVNEDWAVESNRGDIFQLGNASWRVLRVEPGIVRVADAKGQPPSIPFWLGEAPGRTRELAAEIGRIRELIANSSLSRLSLECGEALPEGAAIQIAEYVSSGREALGAVPTQKRVILERFFDESGGMQVVVHAPFGSKINRAWGLALRKKFCTGFGFELQAAANEESIVLSLGPQHSFDLPDVFDYLSPATAKEVLVQAVLASPLFETRWRWNAQRALLLDRARNGRRVPAPLQRMRANDLLVTAFPAVAACPETLRGGPIEVPMEHPIVAQTIEDCLTEAMDVDGFLEVLRGLKDGSIQRLAVDTVEPSAFARGILASQLYTFLDDAPLEERRTQAVHSRRVLGARSADEIGILDPEAIARVREEAWPQPANAEEVHEALLWMGYVTAEEARPWQAWLDELALARRVSLENSRWFAAEATREPKAILRGRLEALGPIAAGDEDESLLLALEGEGAILRTRIGGRAGWCDRRLLARIHRYTLDRLRREIEPVTASQFLRFLACWQHADPEHRLEGPRGVAQVVAQLAGFEVSAAAWEASVLPARVRGYKREWLDQLTLSGEVAWGRLWGAAPGPTRRTPICLFPRQDLEEWSALAAQEETRPLSGRGQEVRDALERRGAMFFRELARETQLPPTFVEEGLSELIALGLATCDSFSGLRWLVVPASKRKTAALSTGRWSLLTRAETRAPSAEFVARRLLLRTGVVFRKTLAREKQPLPFREIARVLRTLEARGEVRGGRFVAGFDGEQYALPEAVTLLRAVRRRLSEAPEVPPVLVSAADPLNFRGILTPDEKISPTTRQQLRVA
ncbi:MAG: DEAD/DEAH box helicase [Acidobacteriota bacterium]